MGRQRIGEICAKDIWTFAFKCLGRILFPIFLLMPVIVVWRIFFYNPEDFWGVVKFFILYAAVVVLGVWLCSFKTILEVDEENLYIIKKWCFLLGFKGRKIPFQEIKQVTFAEVVSEDTQLKTTLKKIFRLKLLYGLIYKLGSFFLHKGRMFVCITYGEPLVVVEITDIKKNDERYLYLRELQGKLEGTMDDSAAKNR